MKDFFAKEKIKVFWGFLKKKKMLIGGAILILLVFVFFKNGNQKDFSIISPSFGELKETVKATGQVISETDISLSFDKQGRVNTLNAFVGKKVKKGEVLATLEAGNENAKLLEARASLSSAKARLQKVVEGSTNEELNLAQVLLQNAERDYQNTIMSQDVLVSNAYRKLLSSSLEMSVVGNNYASSSPLLSGSLNKETEGTIKVNFYSTGNGLGYSLSGLVSGIGEILNSNPSPLGSSGLYVTITNTSGFSGTEWVVEIPNKKATDYIANKNAYDSALKTKDSAVSSALSLVEQRKAELALKKAGARNSDVLLAEADVLASEARVKDAESNYAKNILRAPTSGVITKVEIKNGEIAQSQKEAIVIQDVANLYVESDINESNITKLKLGQKVELTFDALPKTEVFEGEIVNINPSANSLDGVVNYTVEILLSKKDERVRPGMNSEISVLIQKKDSVLSIPEASVFKKDDKNFVNIVLDEVNKKTEEREVSLGLKGDGNMIEVLSGLSQENKISLPN